MFSTGENIFPRVFAAKGAEPSDVLTVVCCIVYELVHQIAGWIEYGDAAAAWKVGEDQFSALLLKIASSFPGRSEIVRIWIGKGLSIVHVFIGLGARKDAEIIGEIARFQGLEIGRGISPVECGHRHGVLPAILQTIHLIPVVISHGIPVKIDRSGQLDRSESIVEEESVPGAVIRSDLHKIPRQIRCTGHIKAQFGQIDTVSFKVFDACDRVDARFGIVAPVDVHFAIARLNARAGHIGWTGQNEAGDLSIAVRVLSAVQQSIEIDVFSVEGGLRPIGIVDQSGPLDRIVVRIWISVFVLGANHVGEGDGDLVSRLELSERSCRQQIRSVSWRIEV